MKMIKSVKVPPFSNEKNNKKKILHKNQTPSIMLQNGNQVIQLLEH